jgi:hypothetical protein
MTLSNLRKLNVKMHKIYKYWCVICHQFVIRNNSFLGI